MFDAFCLTVCGKFGQKSKYTQIKLKNIIIHNFLQGKTENAIAKFVQKSRTTNHYVIKNCESHAVLKKQG